MSIETVGPERYEFQYFATLELILRFWALDVHAVVDSGGEDATLDVDLQGHRVQIELQVKGAERYDKAVGSDVLQQYLAHFPSRSAENCLLERLLTQPTKVVVIVCAQRAMDFASPLTVRADWRGTPHRHRPLSATAAKEFLSQMEMMKPAKNTDLERERAAAFAELGRKTSAADLNDAFKRLILQESETKESLHLRSVEHLRRLGVPGDRLSDTLLQMLKQVQDSRGKGTDVAPPLRTILDSEAVRSVRPLHYVPRGQESAWIQELGIKRALLLSGPPRCGKSDAARWLAGELQDLGFVVVVTSLAEEAERALRDSRRIDLVVIVDDPLGSELEADSSSVKALKSLGRLIPDLGPNRRLLVAQSKEALLAASGEPSLGAVVTGGLPWHDLDAYPKGFLGRVWGLQSRRNGVPLVVEEAVAAALEQGVLDVPAGVLSHIAAYHSELAAGDVLRQAQSLASRSAAEFAATLRANGAKDVVRALAIGSTVVETSADSELAYLMGQGEEVEVPPDLGLSWPPSEEEMKEPLTASAYSVLPALSPNARERLSNLELHRVIHRQAVKEFQFSHAYYRAAARSVVRQSTTMDKDEVLAAVRRGIFAPAASTSAATARNLWWLYQDLNHSLGLGSAIIDLAAAGLTWQYPNTRDLCYGFLIEMARSEPERYTESLQHWVTSMRGVDLDDVVWENGEPFFPLGSQRSTQRFRTIPKPDETRVRRTIELMREGAALPSVAGAVEVIRFLRGEQLALDKDVLLRLLGFSEGLIRAEAAHTWLSVPRVDDADVLERLRHDTHPVVVGRVLDAVSEVWGVSSPARKNEFADLLATASSQPEAAAVLVMGLLDHFSADDFTSFDDRASLPWGLLADVLSPALRSYPNSFRMTGSKLYDVCKTALNHLPAADSAKVLSAWIAWLELRIAAGHLPDDYMLGVVTAMFDAKSLSEEDRLSCISRVLAFPSTGAVLVFFANLVGLWEQLRIGERELVTGLLVSQRADAVWLKASALTQDRVPGELQELILGGADRFEMPAANFVQLLPPEQLLACVRVHRGHPSPLWYLGHRHDNSLTWANVIRLLAKNPTHPLFEECLEEMYCYQHRYSSADMAAVIQSLDEVSRDRAFGLFLKWKRDANGEFHQPEFDLLLELAPDEATRARMIERMVEIAPKVIERLHDIEEWSQRPDVRQALESFFNNDVTIESLWDTTSKLNIRWSADARDSFAEILTSAVEDIPPRLAVTYGNVIRYVRALKVEEEFESRCTSARKRALEAQALAEDHKPYVPPPPLQNWIGPLTP